MTNARGRRARREERLLAPRLAGWWSPMESTTEEPCATQPRAPLRSICSKPGEGTVHKRRPVCPLKHLAKRSARDSVGPDWPRSVVCPPRGIPESSCPCCTLTAAVLSRRGQEEEKDLLGGKNGGSSFCNSSALASLRTHSFGGNVPRMVQS